jgi:hypothetical protein
MTCEKTFQCPCGIRLSAFFAVNGSNGSVEFFHCPSCHSVGRRERIRDSRPDNAVFIAIERPHPSMR